MPEGTNVEIAHRLVEQAEERKRRGEEILEVVEVFFLAIVAIATAWSGYQAAKWDGHQSFEYGESNRIRFAADAATTKAAQELATDVGLFIAWLEAESVDNTDLMRVFERRMTPDYRVAFNAWLKTDPFNNPNAPAGPAAMPQYRNPHAENADHLNEVATKRFEDGTKARETADKYVRNTVLLAMVLFFVALAQRFDDRLRRTAVNAMALFVLVVAVASVATLERL